MDDSVVDRELYRRARALLEPGEIALDGIIVHTDLDRSEEPQLHEATVRIGDAIAGRVGADETYVYSGNDDPDFGLNQHQGLTVEEDAFVWECQQLLREGTYDVVFYYEADTPQEAIVEDVEAMGFDVTSLVVGSADGGTTDAGDDGERASASEST
jgi:hypothetical protein